MTDFYKYIFSEVYSGRLKKDAALKMIEGYGGEVSSELKVIHPLVQKNASTLTAQKFTTVLTGAESFLDDHIVQNERVLPGVVYLDMARVSALLALGMENEEKVVELENVVFLSPLVVRDNEVDVQIDVFYEDEGMFFEVSSCDVVGDGMSVVNARGRINVLEVTADISCIDPVELKNKKGDVYDGAQCYKKFSAAGLDYGDAHKVITKLRRVDVNGVYAKEVIADLCLPKNLVVEMSDYDFHPSLMDGVLQSTIGVSTLEIEGSAASMVPFSIDSIKFFSAMTKNLIVVVNEPTTKADSKIRRFDIDVFNSDGRICVQVSGFCSRELSGIVDVDSPCSLLLTPAWVNVPAGKNIEDTDFDDKYIILVEQDEVFSGAIQSLSKDISVISISSLESSRPRRFLDYSRQLMAVIKSIINAKKRAVFQLFLNDALGDDVYRGLSSIVKSAVQENKNISGKSVVFEKNTTPEVLFEYFQIESVSSGSDIRYISGEREVVFLQEFVRNVSETGSGVWKENGVYLITGGLGGLGRIFAEHIVSRVSGASVVLTGRSSPSAKIEETLSEIKKSSTNGSSVSYLSLDLLDALSVERVVSEIEASFGPLNGVLHSAGTLNDGLLLTKSERDLESVYEPKVQGLTILDEGTAQQPLDFFVMFSSTTAVFGNAGQSDYAGANAYMDAYSQFRQKLVGENKRRGRTLSINWPLWNDGGMNVNDAIKKKITELSGLEPLEKSVGLNIFEEALAMDVGQIVVLSGNNLKREAFGSVSGPKILDHDAEVTDSLSTLPVENNTETVDFEVDLLRRLKSSLISEISEHLKVPIDQIDEGSEFSEFGFDSITLTGFGNRLNILYGIELTPTTFFEYPCVEKVAQFLLDDFESEVKRHVGGESANKSAVKKQVSKDSSVHSEPKKSQRASKAGASNSRRKIGAGVLKPKRSERASDQTIAIVGVSGCFPDSPELSDFWDNLNNGRDCIGEIPGTRWDWGALYGNPDLAENKTNVKHAGIIDEIDKFDPLFFGISPREAEAMDPQQRVLMTYVWKVIEDAGYAPQSLSGSNTGIFIGTGSSGYSTLLSAMGVPIEGYSVAGIAGSVGPNRMSYLLNLHGPSEPIETACSSSLVAVHRAVRSIRIGDCDQAIVGGVNLLVSPESHISFNKAGMLSADGRCKTFSKEANGYVRGEGVGMLMLKPLSRAEEDGDQIYGLIKGSAENHGGRANSLTSPNPRAQAELIKTAFRESGIDPRTINYIEAHGTGTPLGDPIEVQGLKSAFSELATEQDLELDTGYCALGSVKTNIGHLELAAGIAGMIKVLLQMKHKTLVPSLHCDEINPYIDLTNSPFHIVTKEQAWDVITDDAGNALPRRAGVSSFGFGGVNAHVVLEEYIQEASFDEFADTPVIIPLSAKHPERLNAQIRQLRDYLQGTNLPSIRDIAYTLQVGRDAMDVRWACVVTSIEGLIATLEKALEGESQNSGVFEGEVKKNKDLSSLFFNDEDFTVTLKSWVDKRKLEKVAEVWVLGIPVGWHELYPTLPRRLSLPSYAFAKDVYWRVGVVGGPSSAVGAVLKPNEISAVLHRRCHEEPGLVYKTAFNGAEFFLTDHIVSGRKTLPAAVYIEMARAAFSDLHKGECAICIENVVFLDPIVVEDSPVEVYIELFIEPEDVNRFEIFTIKSDLSTRCIHAQGVIGKQTRARGCLVNTEGLVKGADLSIGITEVYQYYNAAGISYGEGHRAINGLFVETSAGNPSRVIATISLPEAVKSLSNDFVLHPSILDGAFQSLLGFSFSDNSERKHPAVPFSIEAIDIYSPIVQSVTILVVPVSGVSPNIAKYNIDIIDLTDTLCVRIKGFCVRELQLNNEKKHHTSLMVNENKAINDMNDLSTHGGDNEKGRIEKLHSSIRREVSKHLSINIDVIDIVSELSEFGFDSVTLTGFGNHLNERYGFSLLPTTFFEYPTIELLCEHLLDSYSEEIEKHFPLQKMHSNTDVLGGLIPGDAGEDKVAPKMQNVPKYNAFENEAPGIAVGTERFTDDPVVIVGMSGCFPEAENLDVFWNNLEAERDCITEIPSSRWDWDGLYGDPTNEINKTNIKHAGVIEELDKFDPLFFGISPKEAETMDPQQRLLMTYVWKAIEDAGHAPGSLSGTNTGVFIATGGSGYGALLGQAGIPIEGYTAAGTVGSVGPNRISFLLNLHGPSEPIETACSSSLVAIHRAVNAINLGQCDQAIVGGVNTLVSPEVHISFNKAGMLSLDGKCKSFSNKANGYVRGEGVGMLYLKRQSDAEKDGNQIYAVIRGTAENHGGRSNSLTAPNPKAQAQVIKNACADAGVNPNTISYVEAHGTGTPLGDPVEIQGLKLAFGQERDLDLGAGHYCGIGSVKTNIGHLELAAGVAGVIKVLLQIKNRRLVKSLHCDAVNKYISIDKSPFYFVNESKPWVGMKGKNGDALPLRAGVSSFGFGGVNSHIILEEKTTEIGMFSVPTRDKNSAYIVVLSAKDIARLNAQVLQLSDYLNAVDKTEIDLASLAFTLQVGRDAMSNRIAIVVSTLSELKKALASILSGNNEDLENVYHGDVRTHREFVTLFSTDLELNEAVEKWVSLGKLAKIAELWVKGVDPNWSRLYSGMRVERLHLPTYPFAKDRYWPDVLAKQTTLSKPVFSNEKDTNNTHFVSATTEAGSELPFLLKARLSSVLSDITNIPVEKIDCDEELEVYGIDSIVISKLNDHLSAVFSGLSKTLFFECGTLNGVVYKLIEQDRSACQKWCEDSSLEHDVCLDKSTRSNEQDLANKIQTNNELLNKQRDTWKQCISEEEEIMREPIAIVGLDGRYAKSNNLEEFWENLEKGRDCISEIPSDRWSADEFYDPDKVEGLKQGKSYSKWGGFVNGFDEFDPMFFGIVPKEALNMDPQERLFLQMSWSAMEDAGYSRERLEKQHNSKVGVFVGITKTGFSLYGPDLWRQGETILPNTSFSSIANRVSYVFNLRGPSMPIDTMCSASLTAIHEACENIYRGECELAIAGGVNLYLHSSSYIQLCAQQMLSPTGKCKSFGEDADGFVPGEGVGAVLLKRLSEAERDGDHIYGVIRSTSVNHGGKTNGYTVPNPNAHSELIKDAIDKAGVHPRTISFVEAHGTGTSLGDPIEVTGLTNAFRSQTENNGFCALGSAKSNIGHCESAAGIAGLTKVLLQMKHKKIVPSLHSERINPNIDFDSTPFVVPQRLTDWVRPSIDLDGSGIQEYPRLAGLSSFGAGGSNAHILIEEYIVEDKEAQTKSESPLPILLSAKNSERLKIYARDMLQYLDRHKISINELAYTLQVGREPMGCRLGFVASSISEVKSNLHKFLSGDLTDLTSGDIKKTKKQVSEFKASNDVGAWVNAEVAKGKVKSVVEMWGKGLMVDLSCIWAGATPKTVSLPTYPFIRDKYWLPPLKNVSGESNFQKPDIEKSPIVADADIVVESVVESVVERDDILNGTDGTILERVSRLLSEITEIPMNQIDGDEALENYGVDSIVITKMNQSLSEVYDRLPKTLFYENFTLSDVAAFLEKNHSVESNQWLGSVVSNEKEPDIPKLVVDRLSQRPQATVCEKDGVRLDSLMLTPEWKVVNDVSSSKIDHSEHLVFLCGFGPERSQNLVQIVEERMDNIQVIELSQEGESINENYTGYASQLLVYIQQLLGRRIQGSIRIQLVVSGDDESMLNMGLTSMLKSVHYESPKIQVQVLCVDTSYNADRIVTLITQELSSKDMDVRYLGEDRWLPGLRSVSPEDRIAPFSWDPRGTYLITGGAGGLGLMFAKHIAQEAEGVRLVLTGRSKLSAKQKEKVVELGELGASVEYMSLDVCNTENLERAITKITADYGGVSGIIHSAGLLRDGFVFKKSESDLKQVLSPKVDGVVALDNATANIDLDVFICFSSTSGTFGNVGQSDYAAANAFMDAFAAYRNDKVIRGERKGRTLSIDWPLWESGGMQIDETHRQAQWDSIGFVPLASDIGLDALSRALSYDISQAVVLFGDCDKIQRNMLGMDEAEISESKLLRQALDSRENSVAAEDIPSETSIFVAIEDEEDDLGFIETVETEASILAPQSENLQESIANNIADVIAAITDISFDSIEIDEALEEYGIDSVVITQINHELSAVYPTISKTLFYEFQTIEAVAEYLTTTYSLESNAWVKEGASPKNVPDVNLATRDDVGTSNLEEEPTKLHCNKATEYEPIAIVGLAGRYPESPDLDTFWDNIEKGKNCVSEIPETRWRQQDYYIEDPQTAISQGKSYCKWAGLLENITDFDADFFKIPVREAASIDPQERLFLQSSWSALEDAGYGRDRLKNEMDNEVGVFVGITKTGFDLYCPDLWKIGEEGNQRTSFSSVANRVSYLFDFNGPSMPIDTMCSSSITAIHQACLSLQMKECKLAIAGGVNLYMHSTNLSDLCGDMMLSPDGKCRSFGEGANGFVPAEGVGTVVLKPLSEAKSDGDHIYGVIRATTVNHGGKVNGYRVPNPIAQKTLVERTLVKANIHPRDISYVEAHGTGTSLGDPIEVTGLTKAFREKTEDRNFCYLGSVKTNIGHAESAAGMAGLTKILLQMKNKKIVPSLHSEKTNNNIDFSDTPFSVPQASIPWDKPSADGDSRENSRIACLSSFGAGGANAHLIVEEYDQEREVVVKQEEYAPLMFLVSGSTKQALMRNLKNMERFLTEKDVSLSDVAYTLQKGRDAKAYRFACVESNVHKLIQKIKLFLAGEGQQSVDYFLGGDDRTMCDKNILPDDQVIEFLLDRQYEKVAEIWAHDRKRKWGNIWSKEAAYGRYISLPTYAYEPMACWPEGMVKLAEISVNGPVVDKSKPLSAQIGKPIGGKEMQDELKHGDIDSDLLEKTIGSLKTKLDLNETEAFVLEQLVEKLRNMPSRDAKPKDGGSGNNLLEEISAAARIGDQQQITVAAKKYGRAVLVDHAGGAAGTASGDEYLTSLGLESINAIAVKRRLHNDLALDVDPTDLLNGLTFNGFVDLIIGLLVPERENDKIVPHKISSVDPSESETDEFIEVEI